MDVCERRPLAPQWAAGEQQYPDLFARSLILAVARRFAPAERRRRRRAQAEPIGALAHCSTLGFVV
jgi:hypothetical protein